MPPQVDGTARELGQLVAEAAEGLERVAEHPRQLRRLVRLQTRETPVGPSLDLDGSTGPDISAAKNGPFATPAVVIPTNDRCRRPRFWRG